MKEGDDEFFIKPKYVLSVLKRYGISRDGDWIQISCSHKEIKSFLRNTPWSVNWSSTLQRIDGARSKKSCRFGQSVSRAVEIPAEYQFGRETNDGE